MKTFELNTPKLADDLNRALDSSRLRFRSQTDLAAMLGVSQSKVSRFMDAVRNRDYNYLSGLSVSDLLKLCDLMEVTPFEYFARK